MANKKKIVLKSVILLGFSALVIVVFRYYSMLRPGAFGAIHKEMIAGGIVLALCFLNYFILYPRLYLRRLFLVYLVTTVFCTMAATILEVVLVYPQIKVFINMVSNASPREYYTVMTISLFLRDLCFVFFSFLIKLLESARQENNNINLLLQNTDNLLLARKDTKEKELVTVRLEDISYCQQNENYAFMYLVDGTRVYRNCSLKSLYEQLSSSKVVRVSRKVLVFYRHIVSYDNNFVYVDVTNDGVPVGFEITDAYRQEASKLLKDHCMIAKKPEIAANPEVMTIDMAQPSHHIQQTEKVAAQAGDIHRNEEKQTSQQVMSFIQAHPGCKGSEIEVHFRVSLSTVNRILRQLREEGLIEYTGSKKTGGYRVVKKGVNINT